MVGLGTQDSLDLARDFVATYGIENIQMLWDASFETWRALGVTGQPAALLISAAGEPLKSWFGPFDEAEVLDLIG